MRRLRIVRWASLLAAATGWLASAAEAPVAPGGEAAVVLARVNGEAITRAELEAGLPKGSLFGGIFSRDLDNLRQAKLDRLISAHALAQFLKAKAIEVTPAEIDAQVAQLHRTPPSSGCSCCRYASLEEFMDTLGIDMLELRRGIANDLGTQRYLEARWQKEYPPGAARDALLQTERPRLEKDYIKASHIFLNTFQNKRFEENPEAVRRETRERAESAWRRLQAGEAFATVVADVSEDAMSRPNGGLLGCIPREALGTQFAEALAGLTPGQYGRPVESPWGWHIIRREAMTDADLLGLLRDDLTGRWWDEERQRLMTEAHIERLAEK